MHTTTRAREQHEPQPVPPLVACVDELYVEIPAAAQPAVILAPSLMDNRNTPDTASSRSLVLERLLRDRTRVWHQIDQEHGLTDLIRQMLCSVLFALSGYGLAIGIAHSTWQALAAAIKLPLLFLLTLAICLPMLYLFNLAYGARLTVLQVIALVLTAMMVTSALALASVPMVLFFLITAQNHTFFVLLNGIMLGVVSFVGVQFLVDGIKTISRHPHTEQPVHTTTLLYIWFCLFAIVGIQLAWTLRPFFGNLDAPFTLFGGSL